MTGVFPIQWEKWGLWSLKYKQRREAL